MGIRELFRRDGAVAAAVRLPIPPPPTGGDSWVSPWQAEPNDLGSALLAELFGFQADQADHLPVTRSVAMSVASIARIRRTICTTVGRLPLLTYAGDQLVADPTSRGYAPVGQLEVGRPSAITFAWLAEAVWFYGRAWLVVTGRYADTKRPASFEWVPEWQAKLASGQLVGHTDGRTFQAADVVRIDGPDEGLLQFGARTIRGAARLERAAVRTSDNPVPTIDLHYTGTDTMTDDEIDRIIARFAKARAVSPIGWTSGAIEAKPLAMSVEQLLIDGRRAAALDCARVGGVPAWVVDVGTEGSSLTYSNTASRSRELIDYGVAWILDAIAGRLSLDDILPRGVWCQFDTDVLLRDDFAGRMTSYEIAQRSGVYTTEELRNKERGRPMEGAPE